MSARLRLAVLLACVPVCFACGHVKEFAPYRGEAVYPRVPNQQRLVAQATLQAVEKACNALQLNQIAGKSARVEVNGVFPHSHEDLLDYVATAVEGEAARLGLRIIPRADPSLRHDANNVVVYGAGAPAPGGAEVPPAKPSAKPDEDKPDMRLVASVDWGGIDLRDEQYTRGGLLVGQIIVTILTGGLGILWPMIQKPVGHIFTMLGRVRVTVRAIPLAVGLPAGLAAGDGEASVVIDSESDSGYALLLELPEEQGQGYKRHAE